MKRTQATIKPLFTFVSTSDIRVAQAAKQMRDEEDAALQARAVRVTKAVANTLPNLSRHALGVNLACEATS